MAEKIKISAMANKIIDELEAYSDEIADTVDKDVTAVAKESVKKLNDTSPNRNGGYSEGWKVKTVSSKRGNKRTVVHNTEYRLTHLLENGHDIKRDGKIIGYSDAIPHIAPVEEWAEEELQKRIEEDIGNAN